MGNYNFKEDIKNGKKGEAIVADFFESKGYVISEFNINTGSKYDFKATSPYKNFKVEVKNDNYCITPSLPYLPTRDTGNMFIEYTSWSRNAGIEVTGADLYCYLYGYLKPMELWLIPVDELKKLILGNEHGDIRISKDAGDEGSETEGYLIPRWNYADKFAVYKKIEGKWVLHKNLD